MSDADSTNSNDAAGAGDGPELGDLRNPDTVTQYKAAATIANTALAAVGNFLAPGRTALDACVIGDTVVTAECAKVFKKDKKLTKGLAFPTCVSINECVAHFSPLKGDPKVELAAGDMVKVDLGVHIGGHIALVAHTFVVPSEDGPATLEGPKADVVAAAYTAAEAAAKSMRPGATNGDITKLLGSVADSFGVNRVQGVLMHEMKRWVSEPHPDMPTHTPPPHPTPPHPNRHHNPRPTPQVRYRRQPSRH